MENSLSKVYDFYSKVVKLIVSKVLTSVYLTVKVTLKKQQINLEHTRARVSSEQSVKNMKRKKNYIRLQAFKVL